MSCIFPYPEDSDVPPIIIPFYPSLKYDHTMPDGFSRFAQRNGFTSPRSSLTLNTTRDPAELASLMQSWVYFGLMDEVIGGHVDRRQFFVNPEIRDSQEPTSGFIDIRINIGVDKLLEDYLKAESGRIASIQATRFDHVHRHLSSAWEKCAEFEKIDVPLDSALPPVCLSVRLLLLHLERVFEKKKVAPSRLQNSIILPWDTLLNPLETRLQSSNTPLQSSSTSNTPLVAFLLARGQKSGLCMRKLFHNGSTFDYAVLYYLTSLKSNANAEYHRLCTKNNCQAESIERLDARAHHRVGGCHCLRRQPPSKEVVEIIRSGDIPLISLHRDAAGCIQLRVVQGSAHGSYVAISHVWSDNQLCSEDNGLYQCQLEWLVDLISKMPPDSKRNLFSWSPESAVLPKEQLFWLDTLCVPMDYKHIDVRQQAIDQMDLVYAGASKVLVLDNELQQLYVNKQEILVPCRGLSEWSRFIKSLEAPTEKSLLLVAAYIFRSSWMSRAWTLQEGYLARDCVLQLHDGTVEIGHLKSYPYEQTVLSPLYVGIHPCLHSSVLIYTMIRAMSCRPIYVTKRNLLLRIIDGAHASLVMLLSLLLNLIMWPILISCKSYWSPNYQFYQDLPRAEEHAKMFDEYLPICDSLCKEVRDSLDQLGPQSGSKSHEERFFLAWRALLSRSTTKPEDIHAIMANLTGFSAREVLEYNDTGERMRTMFSMFNKLPLDLLFLDGPKYQSEINDADQWMPIWPCDSELTSRSCMVFEAEGY